MKRILSLTVCLCMLLLINSCGKNSAVVEVEEMIDSIGVISLDSGEELSKIEMYYESLSEGQKDQVENHVILVTAIKEYNELVKASQVISGVSKNIYEKGCEMLDNVTDVSMELKVRGYVDSGKNWYDTYDSMIEEGVELTLNIGKDATAEEKIFKKLIDAICKKYIYICWSLDVLGVNEDLAELIIEDIVNQSKLLNMVDDIKSGKITEISQMEELTETIDEMAGS